MPAFQPLVAATSAAIEAMLMPYEPVENRIFCEMQAGGYPRGDHRMEYIVRVNALLRPDMVVLDFGAGRGKWVHDPVPLRRWLGDFRGRCARVIGADVDPAIAENPQVDEHVILHEGKGLPLPDASVDLVSAFSVLEHIEDAPFWAAELNRVLRPGGWICGWTPNGLGPIGVGARLVPQALHERVLRLLEPRREEQDSFPPVYRMNTLGTLRRLFPPALWQHCSYRYDGRPFYHLDRVFMARLWQSLFWATPPVFKPYLMVMLQKRGGPPALPGAAWPTLPPRHGT
jgi:SAM-dependent methyltransferase